MKTTTGDYEQVKEIPFGYELVTNDTEVEALNREFNDRFGAYFVLVGDGEYERVYGIEGIVPRLEKRVWRVK